MTRPVESGRSIMAGLSLAFAAFVMAAFVAGPASAETNKIRIGVQSVPPDEVYLAKAWYKPYGIDRKSVVWGKRVSGSVAIGGRRIIKKNKQDITRQYR